MVVCMGCSPLMASPRLEHIEGWTRSINASSPVDSFKVTKNGLLRSDGATINSVWLEGSRLRLGGNTLVQDKIIAAAGSDVIIQDSRLIYDTGQADISLVLQGGSRATIDNSTVHGAGGGGITVAHASSLILNNTDVTALPGPTELPGHEGWAVGVFGSEVSALAGSYLKGHSNGVWFSRPGYVGADDPRWHHGRLIVDNSTVAGVNGAAILVHDYRDEETFAEIIVRNGSELFGGNGNLLEAFQNSRVKFTVDSSVLNGNLVADDSSTLNVILQNKAQLTGDISNGNTLAINSGARWQMAGANEIKSLSMDGGGVHFSEAGFHTLSLGELSGNGAFAMRVDLDRGVGDMLKVNGQANGNFGLRVRNSGVEAVSPDMQPLMIVHTEGGDAQFSLIGGRVDLGAYSYLLEQQGNDWFIVGDGRTTSPSTNTALALYNAAPSIWKSELSTLRTRMGEIRNGGTSGGWMRAYGNRLNATTGDGIDYRQQTSGLSLGADAPVDVSNGQLLFGVLGGYSKSDLDLSHGTKGKVNSYYVGAYGTWLLEDGYYLDGVLKLNRFRNKADVAMSDATKAKGNYTNTGIGGSLEFGRHIKLADDYFLEPFAQFSTVVIQGDDYRLNNGLEAKNQRTRSVLGKVGTSAGRNIPLKDGGVLQPYVRVAMAQEFSRNNDVEVNDSRFDNSLFGSRAELGAGVSVSLSERVQVHADFDYMKGKRVEQPWGANVGLRIAF